MFHIRLKVALLFIVGFVIGFLIALFLSVIQPKNKLPTHHASLHDLYEPWFVKQNLRRYRKTFDTLRYSGQTFLTESTYLYNKIEIACLVLVRRIKYVKAAQMTWGTQCNHLEFINLKPTKNKLPSKKNITNSAWYLLCKNLSNLPDTFHWVLVLNENTFALLENLRYLVAPLNSSAQYYLGHSMVFWGIRYNSGQAGYLISNGTLSALKRKVKEDSCSSDSVFWNLEDYYLGEYCVLVELRCLICLI
uniref:Hexosyltransferase n=1 Tax=Photinus pyralis TaxID=7054 RepID=A0A1Y1N1R7_PHOPY